MFEAEVPEDHILAAIKELRLKYQTEDFSFQIELLGGGFQFLTKTPPTKLQSVFLSGNNLKRGSLRRNWRHFLLLPNKQPITKGGKSSKSEGK